jgi:phosphotransferase system enzyme I (PtsI)
LSLIKDAVSAAHRHRLKVSVCGEMAADPVGAVLLVGLGVDELSVSFQSVGVTKKIIKSINYTGARQIAENALKMRSQAEILDYLKSEFELHFPELTPVFQFIGRNSDG